jgi:hypothetical protein
VAGNFFKLNSNWSIVYYFLLDYDTDTSSFNSIPIMNCIFCGRASIIACYLACSSSSIVAVLLGVFAASPVVSVAVDVDVKGVEPDRNIQEVAATTATGTAAQQCLESDDSTCGAEISDERIESSSLSSSEQPPAAITANPDGHALISPSELSSHVTIENRIWLSILGKVYDVTEGDSFYGFTKGSYKFYAGRDASPCFATGNNTPEGADEKIEEWTETSKLIGVYEWAVFYEDHEKYKFMGVLANSRYYDANGIETSLRRDFVSRASAAKEIADAEREKRKKERMDAKMERRKKLYG